MHRCCGSLPYLQAHDLIGELAHRAAALNGLSDRAVLQAVVYGRPSRCILFTRHATWTQRPGHEHPVHLIRRNLATAAPASVLFVGRSRAPSSSPRWRAPARARARAARLLVTLCCTRQYPAVACTQNPRDTVNPGQNSELLLRSRTGWSVNGRRVVNGWRGDDAGAGDGRRHVPVNEQSAAATMAPRPAITWVGFSRHVGWRVGA